MSGSFFCEEGVSCAIFPLERGDGERDPDGGGRVQLLRYVADWANARYWLQQTWEKGADESRPLFFFGYSWRSSIDCCCEPRADASVFRKGYSDPLQLRKNRTWLSTPRRAMTFSFGETYASRMPGFLG